MIKKLVNKVCIMLFKTFQNSSCDQSFFAQNFNKILQDMRVVFKKYDNQNSSLDIDKRFNELIEIL